MVNEFSDLITTVGFPIVAYLLMVKRNDTLSATIIDLSVTLKGIDTRLEMLEKRED